MFPRRDNPAQLVVVEEDGKKKGGPPYWGRAFLFLFVGVPLLGLVTCTYGAFSPHLLLDPLIRDIDQHDTSSKSPDRYVSLIPEHFALDASYKEVQKRLNKSGFKEQEYKFSKKNFFFDGGKEGRLYYYTRRAKSGFLFGVVYTIEIGVYEGRIVTARGTSQYDGV